MKPRIYASKRFGIPFPSGYMWFVDWGASITEHPTWREAVNSLKFGNIRYA